MQGMRDRGSDAGRLAFGGKDRFAWARVCAASAILAILVSGLLGQAYPRVASAVPVGSSAATDMRRTSTPSSTPAPKPKPSTLATTGTFARMAGSKLRIHLPALSDKLVAVGFHQADNRKALRFLPSMKCHRIDTAAKTRALLKKDHSLKLFQQPLRGRHDSNFTAADCAVLPKTTVVAPVSGVVTSVRHYKLYGRIYDLRLEIKPDGARHLRVVMIHITGVKVKKGQRVVGGITPVAVVRHLKLDSTINRFVPVKRIDHVHVQVNRDTFKGSY